MRYCGPSLTLRARLGGDERNDPATNDSDRDPNCDRPSHPFCNHHYPYVFCCGGGHSFFSLTLFDRHVLSRVLSPFSPSPSLFLLPLLLLPIPFQLFLLPCTFLAPHAFLLALGTAVFLLSLSCNITECSISSGSRAGHFGRLGTSDIGAIINKRAG